LEAINGNPKVDPCDRELPETDSQQSPEASATGVNEIASQLKNFQTSTELSLSNLVELVESRLALDDVKEKAFDRLYAELDELKQDREFEQLRPFFSDLVLLFDRLDHLANESLETQDVSSIVVSIREELLEILSRRGVDIISPSEQFDPAFQNALGTERTSDEEANNRIARVVRRGFRYNLRVLRHEEVFVYRFVPGELGPDVENSSCQPDSDTIPMAPDQKGSEYD
jgi:molecular chaperone GrpE (heat shock protein)